MLPIMVVFYYNNLHEHDNLKDAWMKLTRPNLSLMKWKIEEIHVSKVNASEMHVEMTYPKIYELIEEIDNKQYSIKFISSSFPLDQCYGCKYLKIGTFHHRTVYEKQTNWLPNNVLDIIFRWYLIDRYEYYIPSSSIHKRVQCNVAIYEKWKNGYCNRSTEYSEFYCQKLNGECSNELKIPYVQNMRPISSNETFLFQKYFSSKYFFESSSNYLKMTKSNETDRRIKQEFLVAKEHNKLPLCSIFYSGTHFENFYPNISQNNTIRNIYRTYVNDIVSQGLYIDDLWIFKDCTYFPNDDSRFNEWYEFYGNYTRTILNYNTKNLKSVKEIALNPYIRDKVRDRNILLQIIQWVDAKAHTNIVARDTFGLNFNLTYQLHGIPIRHLIDFDIHKDIEYHLKNIIEDYRNGKQIPHVVVINYDNHPAAFSYQYYMNRLPTLTAMVVRLLREVPHIKILYRGAGKQPRKHIGAQYVGAPYSSFMKQALELGTEYLQFMNSRFLYHLWLLLRDESDEVKRRFIFLNFYEMTELLCKANLHPCDTIVIQQFYIILNYF
ncbi:hypothetical protein SNEBB_005883 [Seison nebaliae]|nr:hypothetical protein SNEBB_005883 [Seison nebaliae]